MADCTFSRKAFAKVLLHCFKYPHCAVNGVLLSEKARSKEDKEQHISDSIPLFHMNLTLTPMLEIALSQVDAYCKEKELQIVGYYQANELVVDNAPTQCAKKICERIGENLTERKSILLMVDNKKLGDRHTASEAFRLWRPHDNNTWKEWDGRCITEEDSSIVLQDLLGQKQHRQLIDYDNHLDNIELDWRNEKLNDAICAA